MSPAEIILRIGAPLGALLILGAHALTIGALMRVDCHSVSHANWTGTAVLAVMTLIASSLAGLALPWRRRARGLAIPALLLAGLLLASVAQVFLDTTVWGAPLCGARDAAGGLDAGLARALPPRTTASRFERVWPLLQLGVALVAALQAIRYLRPARRPANTPFRSTRPSAPRPQNRQALATDSAPDARSNEARRS